MKYGKDLISRGASTTCPPAIAAVICANLRGTVRIKSVRAMAKIAGTKNGRVRATRLFVPSCARARSTKGCCPSRISTIACGNCRYCFNVKRRTRTRRAEPTRQTKSKLRSTSLSRAGALLLHRDPYRFSLPRPPHNFELATRTLLALRESLPSVRSPRATAAESSMHGRSWPLEIVPGFGLDRTPLLAP